MRYKTIPIISRILDKVGTNTSESTYPKALQTGTFKYSGHSNKFVARDRLSGIAALPVLLLTSAIILEVAVVSIVLANVFNNTRYNERLAAEAFGAARAGAQDAALRVIRYKECPATPGCPATSTITVGLRTADVTITDSGGGIITVDSIGTALGRQKKVQAILGVDSVTGEVSLRSFKEVAL